MTFYVLNNRLEFHFDILKIIKNLIYKSKHKYKYCQINHYETSKYLT